MTRKIKRLQRLGSALVCLTLLTACGQPAERIPHELKYVYLIVMENKSVKEALSGPFTASLASKYGVADNYHAVTHPSVPNYLALTSGSTWGITDDSYHVLPKQDLGTQLTRSGITWRAYMEGLGDGGCLNSPLPYDPGHNPFAFYGGACPENVVPFSQLAGDLASPPQFVWITPDRCHDTHDCPVADGDQWLRQTVSEITSSTAFITHGVLFITWDENDGSADNRVLTLEVVDSMAHRTSSKNYNHYSLLATIEDVFQVARLGGAMKAQPIDDLFP